MIANHGRMQKYDHKSKAEIHVMDDYKLQYLTVKLRYLDKWTDSRIMIADEYLERLKKSQKLNYL